MNDGALRQADEGRMIRYLYDNAGPMHEAESDKARPRLLQKA
jgi:hypothetical protein